MVRNITEREIVVFKDDLASVTGMLTEFNVDIVGTYYPQKGGKFVKVVVISEPNDFEDALKWFENNFDGMISVLQ